MAQVIESLWVTFPAACGVSPIDGHLQTAIPRRLRRGSFIVALYLWHGRKQWCSGFYGCGFGGLGAADRGGEAARQDGPEGAATDHLGDRLAPSERGQVAGHPG